MTVFSFFILPKKSLLLEKDRFNKHQFIKKEADYYIFAREQSSSIIEGSEVSIDHWKLLNSILEETEATIYFLTKELKNRESENDFSISKYLNSKGKLDCKEVEALTKETVLFYNFLYKLPFT